MSLNAKTIAAAVAGAIAASLATPASADDAAKTEKCFGISKAGENACAGATHACAGQSKVSNSGQDWTMVKAGTCVSMGGKTQAFDTAKSTTPANKKG